MSSLRLYVDQTLAAGAQVTLAQEQAHYLRHVMRAGEGDAVRLFNGRDGEWQARLTHFSKREATAQAESLLRAQSAAPDLWLVFAPIKHGKIDFLAQKATELGVSCLWPVMTQHTAVARVNLERLRANAIEAAEQSGRLEVPSLREPVSFDALLAGWPQDRLLLYGDESGKSAPAAEIFPSLKQQKLALLIGPEGGFSASEHARLRALSFVRGFGMGPRVMRADTAALAALAVLQALTGDWSLPPHFEAV